MTDIFEQRHGRKNFFFQHVLDDIETVDRIIIHPDFNHHPFGYCVIFSGKKVTAPKSEGARTPMSNSDLYKK